MYRSKKILRISRQICYFDIFADEGKLTIKMRDEYERSLIEKIISKPNQ